MFYEVSDERTLIIIAKQFIRIIYRIYFNYGWDIPVFIISVILSIHKLYHNIGSKSVLKKRVFF